jgi:hypothetical protein
MKPRSARTGWLDLAIRQRQWQVELQQPELRNALTTEQQADQQRQRAQAQAERAEQAQRATVGGGVFTADLLARHAAYASHLQHALADAQAQAEQATLAADELRGQAQALLAERDALQRHRAALQDAARAQAQQRQAREHDEHWLLRRTPPATTAPEDASR